MDINFDIVDPNLFEHINDAIDNLNSLNQEGKICNRKIEEYQKALKFAEDMITKAKEKKDSLMKRKKTLELREEKRKEALKYWEEYGLEVEEEEKGRYKFIYTKLPLGQSCAITLRAGEQELEILAQEPELFSKEKLDELNTRIKSNCVHDNAIDYKLAMLMIKKDLMKIST